MKAVYHRLAVRDVRNILDYYESEAGSPLADRFFSDFLLTVAKAQENPKHFPPLGEFVRRANLTDFPYHFLYGRNRGVSRSWWSGIIAGIPATD